jgi:hypothetical protein
MAKRESGRGAWRPHRRLRWKNGLAVMGCCPSYQSRWTRRTAFVHPTEVPPCTNRFSPTTFAEIDRIQQYAAAFELFPHAATSAATAFQPSASPTQNSIDVFTLAHWLDPDALYVTLERDRLPITERLQGRLPTGADASRGQRSRSLEAKDRNEVWQVSIQRPAAAQPRRICHSVTHTAAEKRRNHEHHPTPATPLLLLPS